MREFTVIYPIFSPLQLLDENGNVIGEILSSIVPSLVRASCSFPLFILRHELEALASGV